MVIVWISSPLSGCSTDLTALMTKLPTRGHDLRAIISAISQSYQTGHKNKTNYTSWLPYSLQIKVRIGWGHQ